MEWPTWSKLKMKNLEMELHGQRDRSLELDSLDIFICDISFIAIPHDGSGEICEGYEQDVGER
jgi:hypothetical protein